MLGRWPLQYPVFLSRTCQVFTQKGQQAVKVPVIHGMIEQSLHALDEGEAINAQGTDLSNGNAGTLAIDSSCFHSGSPR